ncbi:MAG TPA: class II fructose-bisphosphate aldolase [Thermoanaerobaculia bacterium]|nr:class II fructose-bisphosphate aldolase [Thermoanaerobaculia bacterium]
MIHEKAADLRKTLEGAGLRFEEGTPRITDLARLRAEGIDHLIRTAVFAASEAVRDEARELIHAVARATGAVPASIQPFYEAVGRGEVTRKLTVPAHNIRAQTYDKSRALFRAAMKHDVGAFVFEIARSEIGYTEQRPAEYAAAVLAAAVKEGFQGPVFLQGDHFQASAKRWGGQEREAERKAIESLIDEAIAAEFYNIDIDTSTLVDLSHPTVDEQQRLNYEEAAYFTRYIREREPEGIEISVGGEIGEVGKHNTSPEEFRAYVEGFRRTLGDGIKGISKVSIQTGSSHGGVPLPDGSIAQVKIDFNAIREISRIARTEYGIGGAVQHGASTLPEEVFDEFPKSDAIEIHLATGFQNMLYDDPAFPAEMKKEIEEWCRKNAANERKEGQTEEQFIYSTRKKAIGPFKRAMWDMKEENRQPIMDALEAKFEFLMGKLAVYDTKDLIAKYVSADRKASRPPSRNREKLAMSALVVEGEGE